MGNKDLGVMDGLVVINFNQMPLKNLNNRIDYLNESEKNIYNTLSHININQEGYESI